MAQMTNKEVFDFLQENEERLFYAWTQDRENEALKTAWETYQKALIVYGRAIGMIKQRGREQ